MKEIIAISGLNATDNPGPGIPVAKSLYKKHKILGLAYDANEPGIFLDYIFKTYLMPYPSLGKNEFLNKIKEIKNKEGITIIIPCLDVELPLYINSEKELNDLGIKVLIPTKDMFELRNKNILSKLSKSIELKYPKTYEINSAEELINLFNETLYKQNGFMIKGSLYKAYKVYSLEDSLKKFYEISNEWGFPILVQELVFGEEINLVGVGNGKGDLTGYVSIKKLTTTSIGKIWTGLTIKNDKLKEYAEKFVKETKWKGPFELECMVHNLTNEINLIEINPRFPAWVYFATEVGVNLPEHIVSILNNSKIKKEIYEPGKMYIRYTEEKVINFSDYANLLKNRNI